MGLSISLVSLVSSSYYISSYSSALSELEDVDNVRVIIPSNSDEIKTIDADSVDLVTIDVPEDPVRMISSTINPVLFKKVFAAIGNPDIIHVMNEIRFPFHYLLAIKRLKSCPVILTVHEPDPYDSGTSSSSPSTLSALQHELLNTLQKQNVKMLCRFADHIIVHGCNLKSDLAKSVSETANIHVIPHGTLAPYFTRWSENTSTETQTLLFFGRAVPGKGVPYLIEAARKIKEKYDNLNVIIAGNGFDRDQYDELEEFFEIHNTRVDEEEAAELFERAAIVVMPYTDASASGIVSIAGGFSTPVIATNAGALPEIVDDNETGLIVPPGNSAALANAIKELFDNPDLRKQLGENLETIQKTKYNWEGISENTVEIYNQSF